MKKIASSILACVLLAACDFCHQNDTRCEGNIVQVCDAMNWKDWHNCGSTDQKCVDGPNLCYADVACCY